MSWFRNLVAYRLARNSALTAALLSEKLAGFTFQPCGDLDLQTAGFVPPVDGGELAYAIPGGHIFLALCVEKKNLPKQAIDRKTRERCDAIENEQGFKPGRKQTKEIREQVIDELLPRAFATRTVTRVWLDTVDGWLVVDTSSESRADDVLRPLFKAVDKFPLESLRVNRSPVASMTDWLAADEAPGGFTVDQDAELRASGEGKATVRYIRHTLEAADVRRHIVGGKQCTRLAMTWADRISFVLTESLALKGVTALDILKESDADAQERTDADLVLMTGELRKLLADLVDALGGEFIPAAA